MLISSLELTHKTASALHLSHYKCMPTLSFPLWRLWKRKKKSQEVRVVTAFARFCSCLSKTAAFVIARKTWHRLTCRRVGVIWLESNQSEERMKTRRGNNIQKKRRRRRSVCVHSIVNCGYTSPSAKSDDSVTRPLTAAVVARHREYYSAGPSSSSSSYSPTPSSLFSLDPSGGSILPWTSFPPSCSSLLSVCVAWHTLFLMTSQKSPSLGDRKKRGGGEALSNCPHYWQAVVLCVGEVERWGKVRPKSIATRALVLRKY